VPLLPRRRPEPRLVETVALGLIQGPAELLPISSSAHVELLPWMLGWQHARLDGARRKEVAVALHAGTAIAMAARSPRLPPLLLIAATVPPAAAALAWEDVVERRLGTPRAMAVGLLAGSAALVLTDRAPERRSSQEATVADAAWLGLAQAAALAPGVSRAGATRSVARARGFTRVAAVELSAGVALPVLIGAAVLKGVRLAQRRPPAGAMTAFGAGMAASAFSTLAALRLQRRVSVPPAIWAAYRTGLAAAVIAADRRVRHNRSR
jgi:undecaprenyl-diphosphatase